MTNSTSHKIKKAPLAVAACALLGLGSAAVVGVEIGSALGDGAVDERVVHEPVREVLIDAEAGDVTLVPASADVRLRVRRKHLINTPATTQRVAGGVLTLRTSCAIDIVPCTSDYRVGVPAGVTVKVDKPSGTVDARAVGGGVTDLGEHHGSFAVTAR